MVYFLRRRGLPDDAETVAAVLARAKESARVLTEDEVLEVVRGAEAGAEGSVADPALT